MQRRAFLRHATTGVFATGFSSLAAIAGFVPPQVEVSVAPGDTAMQPHLYYAPPGGRVGDVIPFFDGKIFRIFHLFEQNGHPGLTTWQQVTTTDFVHFTERGTMLPRGTPDQQDLSVATGSVIEDQSGKYHIFYTGYNAPGKQKGKPEQGVMHAVSDDLLHWTKVPEDTFYATQSMYEKDDWRDPFVFWNADTREYWMLVAARQKTGPSRRRGCTALCVSRNLQHWEVREPFWAPQLYYTHECPDLFRMGDWWYLIFSEFSEGNQTRYRMSRSLTGPWIAPREDTFDTRAFYAAKTASDGKRRFLFGWNPRKAGAMNDGRWEWGGNLVVHELHQQSNGELYVAIPHTVRNAFGHRQLLQIQDKLGSSKREESTVRLISSHSFGITELGTLPAQCIISATLSFEAGTRSFGLMLKFDDDLDSGYYVRFEPAQNRMVLDLWPRPGDIPFVPGFERFLALSPQDPISVDIVIDGSITEIYVAGQIAMSTRMYKTHSGLLATFVDEGSISLRDISIQTMSG